MHRMFGILLGACLATILVTVGANAEAAMNRAWLHDKDVDGIDDRIEAVKERGVSTAYESADRSKRPIIALFGETASETFEAEYGIYIGYDHAPTDADLDALRDVGLTVLKPYKYIDYVRSQATYDEIEAIASLPGVVRIEAIPMMYRSNHWGSRVVRARDSRGLFASQNYVLFPSAQAELGLDGTGVVVAVLDTGVNDEVDSVNPTYPGHESLKGKFLGGGNFFSGDPLLNTGLDDSENPEDHGSLASSYHGTHVAGTAIGTGGEDAFFAGVAPEARLVDLKVLSDAGAGFGSADGIEWCIHNMNNDWGLTGGDLIYAGIDVLNLSLGGLDASDGTDAGSQMVNAAMNAGLVVCVATGNDGEVDWIASPAAADLSISVGATSHASSLDRSDDLVTDFSNEGPRTDDGDLDKWDEMKPEVVAPGAGILSANGDFTTEGASYAGLSGTSMATPHVAGVAALLVQANPSLTALQIRDILMHTAEHDVLSIKGDRPNDPFLVDPNYDPGCGWGLVDVYAAAKEALDSTTGVQVVQIGASARPNDGEIDVNWITQREYPFLGFNVHRAEDVGGTPGAYTQVNVLPIPGTGDPTIVADDNRTPYLFVDDDAALTLGTIYWYQIEWIDLGAGSHFEPPVPVAYGEAAAVATAYYAITHNSPDNDLFIKVGEGDVFDPNLANFFVIGGGTADRDSFKVHEPANIATAATGYIESFWSTEFYVADNIDSSLPPGISGPEVNAWFLNVAEGGYVNRRGTLNDFSLFVNDSPGSTTGTLYTTNTPTPVQTVEGQEFQLWIPDPGTVGVADAGVLQSTYVMPASNPIRGRTTIRYALGFEVAGSGEVPVQVTVLDVRGRRVRELETGRRAAGTYETTWDARDHDGRRVAPGVYFVRFDSPGLSRAAKLTVLD